MKQVTIIILFVLQSLLVFAQQEKSYIKKGNDLYQQQKFNDAEANYRKSVEKKNQNVEGNFNLGDALYKQKKFTDASEQFNKLAGSANNKAVTAAAYHNLGNSFLENKKLEESIDAYKKALLNNPKDDQTRYNLAYAQEKLKKQQQQNKQNKQNKDNKDQQNQNSNNKDNKNQDKKNQDNKNQDKKDQQQRQPDKMSKEDAQRMLDAMNNNEKQTQEKLKNKKLKGEKLNITKDW